MYWLRLTFCTTRNRRFQLQNSVFQPTRICKKEKYTFEQTITVRDTMTRRILQMKTKEYNCPFQHENHVHVLLRDTMKQFILKNDDNMSIVPWNRSRFFLYKKKYIHRHSLTHLYRLNTSYWADP